MNIEVTVGVDELPPNITDAELEALQDIFEEVYAAAETVLNKREWGEGQFEVGGSIVNRPKCPTQSNKVCPKRKVRYVRK